MKKTTKLVLMSVLTIAMCVSLIAGATFALFTSESSVNIAVTSGKVQVVATIGDLETSGLNGTAMVDAQVDGNNITLNNIVPGDKVEFTITVGNQSNVDIQYRTKIICTQDDGLMLGLVFNVNDEDYSGLISYVSTWATWKATDETTTQTIKASIELPEDAGNEYQDLSCTIAYTIEAVQGNATTNNDESGLKKLVKVSEFVDLKSNLAEGKSILLTNDITVEAKNNDKINLADGAVLDLGGNTLTIDNSASSSFREGLYVAGTYGTPIAATIKNGTIEIAKGQNGSSYAVVNSKNANLTLDNVVINTLEKVNDPTITKTEYALSVSDGGAIITNCTINGDVFLGSANSWATTVTGTTINGRINIMTNVHLSFDNCTLNGDTDRALGGNQTSYFVATNTTIDGFCFKSNGSAVLENCTTKNILVTGGSVSYRKGSTAEDISMTGGSVSLYDTCSAGSISVTGGSLSSGYIYLKEQSTVGTIELAGGTLRMDTQLEKEQIVISDGTCKIYSRDSYGNYSVDLTDSYKTND